MLAAVSPRFLLAALLLSACQPTPPPTAGAGAASNPSSPAASSAPASAPNAPPQPARVLDPPSEPAAPASREPGRVVNATFHSASLGVDKAYVVYLPGGYDAPTARYPVIYLLHGMGGNETNWVKVGGLAETADRMGLSAIVVMPDGDDGFYANWVTPVPESACLAATPPFDKSEKPETYCVKTPRYEDYIVKDLLAHVDATYRTRPERRSRGIAGLSMGGFGALSLAMRHPDLFAASASHSGVAALLYEGPHPYVKGAPVTLTERADSWAPTFAEKMREQVKRVFGPDLANWRAHDPSVLAQKLKDGELALYLDCGTEDGFKFHDQASYLHEILAGRGVAHAFELTHGPHSFKLWTGRIGQSLAFEAAAFAKGP